MAIGVSLYLVAPSVLDVLSSWQDLKTIGVGWLVAMVGLQAAALACLWALQHLALRARSWLGVITSQLAGNGLAKIAPGGGAVGAALQYRMLVQSGVEPTRAVGGLTAANLLTLAVMLALPVMAIPAIIRGGAQRTLVEAAVVGIAAFLVLAGLGALFVTTDGPLMWVGRVVQRARNAVRRHAAPLTGVPARLVRERDRILAALGPRWKRALVSTMDSAIMAGLPSGVAQ